MQRLLIFRGAWSLMLELQGAVATHKDLKRDEVEKKMSQRQQIDVLFSLMGLARQANRQNITHWTFVSNVASMALGVGKADSLQRIATRALSQGQRQQQRQRRTGCQQYAE